MASVQTPSSLSSRENFLEKKIQILDKRLTLVEKFIDLRFRQGRVEIEACFDEVDDDYRSKSITGSRRTTGRKQPLKTKKKNDHSSPSSYSDEDGDSDYSPETGGGKRKGESTTKQKPCPASVKRRKTEEVVFKGRKGSLSAAERLKTSTVQVDTSEIIETNNATTSTTISGRTRRTPKRFEEENFETRKTKSKESPRKRRWEQSDDVESVVKVERPDSPAVAAIFDHYDDDGGGAGADDFDGGEGPNSPIDNDEEAGGEYFTFPGATSPPRSIVGGFGTQESSDRKMNTSFDGGNDRDWDGEGNDDDMSEDDDQIDDEEEKPVVRRRGRKPGTKNKSPRKAYKRGPYKKREPGQVEQVGRRWNRVRPKVNVADMPTDAIANADPTMKLCPQCNWHFKGEVFDAHLESHARERHLKCPECGKSYYNQFILKKHMRIHQPEKYAKKCRRCDKPFVHSDKLLAHERYCVKKALEKNEHVDPELIEDLKRRSKSDTSWIEEAMEAGSKFAKLNTLELQNSRKRCPHCKKNFRLINFDRHVQSHITPKNWQCNRCDKAYHYKHDLVRHVAMEHTSDCQKTLTDKIEFKDHLASLESKQNNLQIKSVTSVKGSVETKVEQVESVNLSEENNRHNNNEGGEENMEESTVGVVEEVVLFDEDAMSSMNAPQREATLELVGGGQ